MYKLRRRIGAPAYHLVISSLSILMLYPIAWMIGSSFKANSEIFITTGSLIPRDATLANYVAGWQGFGGVTFATFFLNSFIISGVGTLASVGSSALVAYGFARTRFVGKNFWFVCMMMTLMLPSQVQVIPQYIMYSRFGWIDTFRPLLVPRFFGDVFFIFLMMQFIRGMPIELDEAAEIDGCGKFGIFFHITLPLIKPALIASTIFSFYWSWEDFYGPLLYLNQTKYYPVALALKNFADPGGTTDWGAIFAMSTLSLVPVLALFILFQRYLVEGISTTGLKG